MPEQHRGTRHHNKPARDPTRPRCPVCHEGVYSPSGIHPQCAVARNESVMNAEAKAAALLAASEDITTPEGLA